MSGALLGTVCLIYSGVAFAYARDHRWGMCLAFVAYALANVGFIVDALRQP